MPFEYSCFISFRHGRQKLAKEMVNQLFEAVASEIELYTTHHKVFIDWEGIDGGDFYPDVLATALCKSACMILVYTPNYFDEHNTFCAREYRTMEMLEANRLCLLNPSSRKHGLIIPIIFRGKEYLPEFISKDRYCYDFQGFSLSSSRISEHPEFSIQVAKLAEYVYERLKDLSSLAEDVCKDCENFRLLSEQEAVNWVKSLDKNSASFPIL